MSRILQRSGWVLALMLLAVSARAFSLFGPLGGGNDSYQIIPTPASKSYGQTLGCFPGGGGYVGAPKNLGEEYRWNIPVVYYAYDQNFLDYFGSNGVVAVEQAISILSNHLNFTNSYTMNGLSGLNPALNQFPLEASRVNYSAQALRVLDMRSATLTELLEEVGLAEPERWAWCLRDRIGVCGGYQYDVIQRNFDPLSLVPSPYVNGTLFTYEIVDYCTACDEADAIEILVDPHAGRYSATASWDGLGFGTFFTGLTRDDMGGLLYLMGTNNMNVESIAPSVELISGGFTNRSVIQLLTSSNLAVFAQQLVTNTPGQIQAIYTNIQISASSGVITNVILTNIVANPTNLTGSSLAITNVSTNILLVTADLSQLASQSLTNTAANLLALFPNLIITGEYPFFTNLVTTNATAYFTNYPWSASGSPPTLLFSTNYTTNVATYYIHTFGNVITNQFFRGGYVTTLTDSITNPPWGAAGTFVTNHSLSTKFNTNLVTGDYYIVPPNLCAYSIIRTQFTTTVTTTNLFLQATNANGSSYSQSVITYFTNHYFVAEPVTCLGFVTNLVPTLVTNYSYSFDNIVTNVYSGSSQVTIYTTNIGPCPGGPVGAICTNITSTNVITNLVSGSFFIIPSNQCGLSIIGTQLVSVVAITNSLPSITNNDGSTVMQSEVFYSTNYTVEINPVNCAAGGSSQTNAALREGINGMTFVRHDFDSLLGQYFSPVTNTYIVTAVQSNQPVAQTFRRVVTQPDFLFTAVDLEAVALNRTTEGAHFYTNDALPNLAGPGTIRPQVTITYNKVGPLRINHQMNFMDQQTSTTNFIWGFFDGTTNAPVIFPNGTDINALENEVFLQITTTNLNVATVGVPYSTPAFTGSGGTVPYTWSVSADSPSGFPAGLTLSAGGTITGTPVLGTDGTYDIRVQITDAGARSVINDFTLVVLPPATP